MQRTFSDQLGNELRIDSPPRRIVSLVPSLTEFLFDLGLDEEIVGVTNFCAHPSERCASKMKVGGTKNFDVQKIKDLNPDFILASKEENTKEGIDELSRYAPVWVSDIKNLEDAYAMMDQLGEIMVKEKAAGEIIRSIMNQFSELNHSTKEVKVIYFIWRRPYMTVGGDTFIHHLMAKMGLKNLYENKTRYPIVDADELKRHKPDCILLSSEPYPYFSRYVQEFKALCPESKIVLVDGEYFSWYGSRLRKSVEYFNELIKKLQE